MKQTHLVITLIALLLYNCASLNITEVDVQPRPSLQAHESVIVFDETETFPDSLQAISLGGFKIRGGSFASDCSRETVLNIAREKARQLGGNVVKVSNLVYPKKEKDCYGGNFEMYLAKSVKAFEEEILWSQQRQMEWGDFKDAPKDKMPFYVCAYIQAYFNPSRQMLSNTKKYRAKAVFNTQCSWVKPNQKSAEGLALANLHFKLTQLYAKTLEAEFSKKRIRNYKHWKLYSKPLYQSINKQYEADVYKLYSDTAFGQNKAEMLAWEFKIDSELKEL